MNILDKLDLLMQERGLNKRTLSQSCGIPYTTIIGLYSKGYEGARMSTIRGLAHFFGVTTDYLITDEITDPHYGQQLGAAMHDAGKTTEAFHNTLDEQQLINDYRTFNDEGKEKVRDYVADLADNPKYKKCSEPVMGKQA